MSKVKAYECFLKSAPHISQILNAPTAGKARYLYWLHVREACPDVRLIDIRSRSRGGPYTSSDFRRTAEKRGVPHARCGDLVKVGESEGVIVGHNCSSNFNVHFHAGPYAGSELSVHPGEIEWIERQAA